MNKKRMIEIAMIIEILIPGALWISTASEIQWAIGIGFHIGCLIYVYVVARIVINYKAANGKVNNGRADKFTPNSGGLHHRT